VVENEGQFREFVKDLTVDGSRRDWGSLFLHAKPVTLPKAQTEASGIIENTASKDSSKNTGEKDRDGASTKRLLGAFDESALHNGGYQAIELIRLTNLTPLLWVRVDPMGLYGGRISVFQPDACLAEMLEPRLMHYARWPKGLFEFKDRLRLHRFTTSPLLSSQSESLATVFVDPLLFIVLCHTLLRFVFKQHIV
jgi:hypothetical protein